MKDIEFEQVRLVQGSTLAETVELFNEAMRELRHNRPKPERVSDTAFLIYYTEYEQRAETLAEEKELAGEELKCICCDYYRPILNKDGTERKTTKKAKCELWHITIFQHAKAESRCYERLAKK